jgi:hypothetical protein
MAFVCGFWYILVCSFFLKSYSKNLQKKSTNDDESERLWANLPTSVSHNVVNAYV